MKVIVLSTKYHMLVVITPSSRREILPPSTAKSLQISIRFLRHTYIVFVFLFHLIIFLNMF